jgi:hypothetical protein
MKRIITSVEPARRHIDTFFSVTAKDRSGFRFRHLRSADKYLPGLDTDIAVTISVTCDRVLF